MEKETETERILCQVKNGIHLKQILEAVEKETNVRFSEIQSERRFSHYCDARKLFAAVAIYCGFRQRDLSILMNRKPCNMGYYIKKVEDLNDLSVVKNKLVSQLFGLCQAS